MENNEWVCTDPSNNQYRKNLPDGTFLFKEDRQNSPFAGDTYTFECTINIDDYPKEEIESVLSAFGYKYEEIENDRELIAECLFEMED